MDINVLRQIAVVLGAVAFLGICWWAFSPKRKQRFEEDAQLPFADEEQSARSARHAGAKDSASVTDREPSAQGKKERDEQ